MSRCTDDIIIDRLKKGREEAIKKQTYLEVCAKIMGLARFSLGLYGPL